MTEADFLHGLRYTDLSLFYVKLNFTNTQPKLQGVSRFAFF